MRRIKKKNFIYVYMYWIDAKKYLIKYFAEKIKGRKLHYFLHLMRKYARVCTQYYNFNQNIIDLY